MSGWWSSASIRVRLTAWYTAVLALMLIAYAAATYFAVSHEFREQLEDEARSGVAERNAEQHVEEQLDEILVVLVLGLPIAVAVAGVGGYVLARRALAPIDQLAIEARRITAERLHERLSVPNQQDEIGRLAAVVNDTFARLQSSFDQLKRFTADASHELRTPLSVIRGIGELTVRDARTPAEYTDAIGSMLEEVDRLSRMIDTLLRLSRADASVVSLSPELIDLGDVAREVAASLSILADDRQQQVRISVHEAVRVSADRFVLRDAIANLIDNAIKYSPVGSSIGVEVRREADAAVLSVSDQGPGIPVEHRSRIFDRFYRIDEARSRELGGTGLGLAIAKWAVEISGGRITVDSTSTGSVFTIAMPAA